MPNPSTPLYGISEMIQAQAQPHVIFNLAIRRLEVLASRTASAFEATPPSAVDGAVVVVDDSPTGVFEGRENQIAYAVGGSWAFIEPREGELWYVDGDIYQVAANGSFAAADIGGGGGGGGAGLEVVRITPSDLDSSDRYLLTADDAGKILVVDADDITELLIQSPGDGGYELGHFTFVMNAISLDVAVTIDASNNSSQAIFRGDPTLPPGTGALLTLFRQDGGTNYWTANALWVEEPQVFG